MLELQDNIQIFFENKDKITYLEVKQKITIMNLAQLIAHILEVIESKRGERSQDNIGDRTDPPDHFLVFDGDTYTQFGGRNLNIPPLKT